MFQVFHHSFEVAVGLVLASDFNLACLQARARNLVQVAGQAAASLPRFTWRIHQGHLDLDVTAISRIPGASHQCIKLVSRFDYLGIRL